MKQIKAGIFSAMTIGLMTTSLCGASASATLLNPISNIEIPAATHLAQLSSSSIQHQLNSWRNDTTSALADNYRNRSAATDEPATSIEKQQINAAVKASRATAESNSRLDIAWKTASLVAIDGSTSLPENIMVSRFDVATAEKHSVDVQTSVYKTSATADTPDNGTPGTLIFLGLGLIGLGLSRRARKQK